MTLIAILIRASNALLMIILPIGLGIYWTRRYKLGWRLWWLGGMTFILSQVGHLPFNWLASNLFNTGVLPLPDESWRLIFNALFLGFSAGLWEEGFRLAAYYLWARDTRTWPKAVLLGAGHGGIEAILLGGLVLLTLFQMVALYNADLPGLVPADEVETLQNLIGSYWGTPWHLSLLGAVERVFALLTHMALSVIVWQVLRREQIRWLALAIGWHALTNAVAVYTMGRWGPYAAEGVLALVALLDLLILKAFYSPPKSHQPEGQGEIPASHEPVKAQDLPPVEITAEKLDETRYN